MDLLVMEGFGGGIYYLVGFKRGKIMRNIFRTIWAVRYWKIQESQVKNKNIRPLHSQVTLYYFDQ